jgi:hypothetical protein
VFGRCYSHAAIVVDDKYVVHAFADARSVQKTEIDWHTLQRVRGVPRPQITYDMWAKLRMPL